MTFNVSCEKTFGMKGQSHSPHFLENLACLCLGGAHFKQCVSTVKTQNVKCLMV